MFQLRVVKQRVPSIKAERFPIPRVDDQFLIGHRVEIGRLYRVVPAAPLQLGRVDIEDVEDVAGGRAAELDAHRIGKDQLGDLVAGGDRDLGGEPAAEGQPQQCDLVVGQLVEHGEIKMDEVVDRVEIARALRIAEAGRRGGDDLGIAAEQVEKRRFRLDRIEPVQQQQGGATAAAQ